MSYTDITRIQVSLENKEVWLIDASGRRLHFYCASLVDDRDCLLELASRLPQGVELPMSARDSLFPGGFLAYQHQHLMKQSADRISQQSARRKKP